jgi:non-ribosomal peptide synthetase component E (peptide arylation enzyme)
MEGHIVELSKVNNAAVAAMTAKSMGECICPFVVPQVGVTFTLSELDEFLLNEQKIAKFKVPEPLEFMVGLPITNGGQV